MLTTTFNIKFHQFFKNPCWKSIWKWNSWRFQFEILVKKADGFAFHLVLNSIIEPQMLWGPTNECNLHKSVINWYWTQAMWEDSVWCFTCETSYLVFLKNVPNHWLVSVDVKIYACAFFIVVLIIGVVHKLRSQAEVGRWS